MPIYAKGTAMMNIRNVQFGSPRLMLEEELHHAREIADLNAIGTKSPKPREGRTYTTPKPSREPDYRPRGLAKAPSTVEVPPGKGRAKMPWRLSAQPSQTLVVEPEASAEDTELLAYEPVSPKGRRARKL